ncbi:hypothetical protein L1049_015635 [Liquidambar formosana]|uniref:Uncharacterized protein n=1 Tax=Liquidambar formosana TaxID=63359 RepID=A0AAP0S516_LIQFO
MEEEQVPLVYNHCNSRPSTRWVPPVMDSPDVKIQCTGDDLSSEMELELPPNARVESSSRPSTRCVPSVIDSPDVKIQIIREDFPREIEGEKRINALLNRSSSCSLAGCISSVPTKLYKLNKQAYTPQAVAIGPIHYGKALLCPMQLNKEHYLKCFFNRTAADKSLYYQKAKEWEEKARACYQDHIDMKSDEFVDMLLLDGIFIIEFYLRWFSPELREKDDDIFKKEVFRDDVFHELVVLENQLPFFVLKGLYNLSDNSLSWEEFLYGIAIKHWGESDGVIYVGDISRVKETLETHKLIRHLADFVHAICVVAIPRKQLPEVQKKCELSRSATELHKAGVKFILAKTKLSYDLDFSEVDGSLEIPYLLIDRWTESYFRNFIALEHCLHKDMIISSYIILMANLLKTPKDVDFPIECEILHNTSLGDSEDVCTLFKNLYSKSMMDKREFYYTHLCKHLNEYSKDSWHQWKSACYMWKEMLKRDYFSNPWSILSVIAAFVLLVLTIIQTVSSVVAMRWI